MPRAHETTFVLHGLDEDNRIVRARVFVQKLNALLQALQTADKIANGKQGFDFMLADLRPGSAAVTVREKQRSSKAPPRSAIGLLEDTATAIYNGDRSLERLPPSLVDRVQRLGRGVAKRFSHAELAFSDNNVIRIDDFLLHQSEVAYSVATHPETSTPEKFYRGLALGSFDGFLKEIDARGTMLRGKLVLTAGGVEIDCVMNKERVPEARESFDKRVVIEGMAHYDGEDQLPIRLDVHAIKIVDGTPDIIKWRGAFRSPAPDEIEEDW